MAGYDFLYVLPFSADTNNTEVSAYAPDLERKKENYRLDTMGSTIE